MRLGHHPIPPSKAYLLTLNLTAKQQSRKENLPSKRSCFVHSLSEASRDWQKKLGSNLGQLSAENGVKRWMPRKLVWVEETRFRGFASSECSWRFDFVQLRPTGKSFDEMMRNFELQRDKEFTSHVCANHPKTKSAKRAM
jgi:hypothetical protein